MLNKESILVCDECQGEFTPLDIIAKTKTVNKKLGVKCVYYKCPHCKKRYLIMYTNPYIEGRMTKYRKALKHYTVLVTSGKCTEQQSVNEWEKVNTLKQEIKHLQDNLAQRWE